MTRGRSAAVVFGLLVLALAWEVWAVASGVPGTTISEVVWRATIDHPMVPLLAGVVIGHWFWQRARCPHCGRRPWEGKR